MKLGPLPSLRDLALRLVARALPSGPTPAPAVGAGSGDPDLRSARQLKALVQGPQRTVGRALALTAEQVASLRAIAATDPGWERLYRLFQVRHLDSWLSDDWPRSFDELVVCAALCDVFSFECTRCPVGQTQEGRSCGHPDSAFGRIGVLVGAGDRSGLLSYLDELGDRLARLPPGA
jgi:hypothetical protein